MDETNNPKREPSGLDRRDFLKTAVAAAGAGAAAAAGQAAAAAEASPIAAGKAAHAKPKLPLGERTNHLIFA